jgi:hypothetical protein
LAGRWLVVVRVALLFDISKFPWRSTNKKFGILSEADIHPAEEERRMYPAEEEEESHIHPAEGGEESHIHLAEEESHIHLAEEEESHIHLAEEGLDCRHPAECS